MDKDNLYFKGAYRDIYRSKMVHLGTNKTERDQLNIGIKSKDKSSIIGKEGWIFINSGSNNLLEYFSGKLQISEEKIIKWTTLLKARVAWHKLRNIKYVHLFIPSKLCVYPEFFPYKISVEAERPIIKLNNYCGHLFAYPLDKLLQNKNVYRLYEKQDSHWSFWGCFIVYKEICHRFGIKPNYELLYNPIKIVTEKSDLGLKFHLQETKLHKQIKFNSKVVYDNGLIDFCHRGTIIILKNNAVNSGKMIIFGDSFSNPGNKKRKSHRLASLFAETLREVHFIWSPWIDHEYIEQEKPDFVLTEMAERFLIKVPQDLNQPSIQNYSKFKLNEYREIYKINNSIDQSNYTKESFNSKKVKENIEELISEYKKAITIKPDYIQPLIQLGEIYETQENWSEAAKYYNQMASLNPSNHGGYLRLGRVLAKQDKVYGAIAAYAEAIELKPDLGPGIYKAFGDLLLKVNDKNPDAIAPYQKAAEIKSDWGAGFYNNFADLLDKNGKLDEATTYYLKALCLEGENPTRYLRVGNIYFKRGLLKEAAGNYQKALEFNPEFVNAYKRLGDLLKQKNQLDDAVKCYQKALEIKPDFKNCYRALGNVFKEQGKQSEAEKCYQLAS